MNPRLKKLILAGLFFHLLAVPACAPACPPAPPTGKPSPYKESLTIVGNGPCLTTKFNIELALTQDEQTKGLMNRKTLPENYGMLFIFERPDDVSFWMKDTLVPLDMLFIDEHGKIFNIHENAVPNDLTSIPSNGPAKAVLEIAGGQVKTDHIAVGDKVLYKTFK